MILYLKSSEKTTLAALSPLFRHESDRVIQITPLRKTSIQILGMKHISIILPLLLLCIGTSAQNATLYGKVTDDQNSPLIGASVYVEGNEASGTITDVNGLYELRIPSGKATNIVFSYTGYKTSSFKLSRIGEGERKKLDRQLKEEATSIGPGAEVTANTSIEDDGMQKEEVEQLRILPNSTGSVESMLPGIGLGVTGGQGGGALSSQYSVRGGNYDENLVYVNDFEIYRPQLIRAGQQEGLTFPNMDMIRDLSFSSGGFNARYGDKLSSVLDIRYKRPTSTQGSVEMSLLGGTAHIEGSTKFKKDSTGYRRFRYIVGTRYKNTKYVLGSLDTEGEYTPNFTDVQGYFTFDITREWQLGLIGNYNRSQYQFIPTSRNTAFGLIDFALNLNTAFSGQEVDDFTTGMGGVSLSFVPERDKNPLYLKLLASSYQSDENERIDIIGDYLIGQIESDLGSDDFGEVVAVLGEGTQHQFVRNYLTSNVSNVQIKGGLEINKKVEQELSMDGLQEVGSTSHFLQWGAKYQNERINDKLNEWERLDSAGYSLPYSPFDVMVRSVLKTENNLNSHRAEAYFQDTWRHTKDSLDVRLSYGVRAAYWSMNGEFIVSPRMQFMFKPRLKQDITFRLASGLYYQPPFYREMRRLDGTVNTDLLSQKSLHVVGGYTWDFEIGKTPFKFITEAYYKHLWDLVAYDLDNVRIRYSGDNDATGYVTGIDLRLNGEFVPGQESWVNLSFLRARERLDSIQHYKREVGTTDSILVKDVARPTDQLMSISIFFQDHLPKNENFRMHLNLTMGTGWPFGIPDNNIGPRNTYRFSPYHRVDIGFSFRLWDDDWPDKGKKNRNPFRFTRRTWLSLEAFNLLKVSNQASNTWIKTIYGSQFAVPNYLTSRRINLRLRMEFPSGRKRQKETGLE
jgi:hypothetical protein